LILGIDKGGSDDSSDNLLSKKVTVMSMNFNMLCPLVNNWIGREKRGVKLIDYHIQVPFDQAHKNVINAVNDSTTQAHM